VTRSRGESNDSSVESRFEMQRIRDRVGVDDMASGLSCSLEREGHSASCAKTRSGKPLKLSRGETQRQRQRGRDETGETVKP
jgi:hypothetical protein